MEKKEFAGLLIELWEEYKHETGEVRNDGRLGIEDTLVPFMSWLVDKVQEITL